MLTSHKLFWPIGSSEAGEQLVYCSAVHTQLPNISVFVARQLTNKYGFRNEYKETATMLEDNEISTNAKIHFC